MRIVVECKSFCKRTKKEAYGRPLASLLFLKLFKDALIVNDAPSSVPPPAARSTIAMTRTRLVGMLARTITPRKLARPTRNIPANMN